MALPDKATHDLRAILARYPDFSIAPARLNTDGQYNDRSTFSRGIAPYLGPGGDADA